MNNTCGKGSETLSHFEEYFDISSRMEMNVREQEALMAVEVEGA